QVEGVFEEGEFVAVEAVAPGRDEMNQQRGGGDRDEQRKIFSSARRRNRGLIGAGKRQGLTAGDRFGIWRHGSLEKLRHDSRCVVAKEKAGPCLQQASLTRNGRGFGMTP